ncbi:hypothetical protein SAMN02746089_01403 [Caldanaerobius fijiensis DSM 17918]|uniref:Uncharacterized protein n=1 Tax=Caldanaerobius fijiensis DSM 17918 TaxID=1121256 RepID=A0A1M4ZDE1_9THEO|nr:DUF190 domain-containing protein [Caldanaerobius fijiensis]SHF16073.1 hypothetical protein SAMN02746089_01403 [Caldanaerobius fijiensis DSM 17918]
MNIKGKGKLLKIFIGESDQWHGEPLYHAIVKKIKENNLAGATVIRGIEGYGANSRVHSARILRLSEDLPIVIEIVDVEDKINNILSVLDDMIKEGFMIVIQDVEIYKYAGSNNNKSKHEKQG